MSEVKTTLLEKTELLLENFKDSKESAVLLNKKLVRIMRNINQLTDKKKALDIEIKRQQKSLLSRRAELKKLNSSTSKREAVAPQSLLLESPASKQKLISLLKLIQTCLAATAEFLEKDL